MARQSRREGEHPEAELGLVRSQHKGFHICPGRRGRKEERKSPEDGVDRKGGLEM